MPSLSTEQLQDLQAFLKDWLRHTGRTQADLRRALRASSIRMPVLIEELHRIHAHQGLAGLAERLCGIEELWQGEDDGQADGFASASLEDSLGQLDLLLEEIRQGQQV
ncbi:MAG: hypothetical protein ACK5FE_02120 [Cyanobacteriota bacterium]|jgi:hypothetical protein